MTADSEPHFRLRVGCVSGESTHFRMAVLPFTMWQFAHTLEWLFYIAIAAKKTLYQLLSCNGSDHSL